MLGLGKLEAVYIGVPEGVRLAQAEATAEWPLRVLLPREELCKRARPPCMSTKDILRFMYIVVQSALRQSGTPSLFLQCIRLEHSHTSSHLLTAPLHGAELSHPGGHTRVSVCIAGQTDQLSN
jgi:hypothetical protein